MRRRQFISLLGGAAATVPFGAHAQRAGGVPTVGVLMAGNEAAPDNQKRIAAFRQGLAEHGWKDGDNIRLDVRWSAGKRNLIQQHARELVALAPDVILANSTPVVAEFHGITSTIPVVFAPVAPRRQLHRLHLHRSGADRKMDGAAQGRGAKRHPGRDPIQSGDRTCLRQVR